MRAIYFGALILAVGTCRAEVTCFRTPAQAAAQLGEQEGGGFRLEFVRRDALTGRSWARVRSCAHPEWPAVLVPSEASAGEGIGHALETAHAKAADAPSANVLVKGGETVRILATGALARIEMRGIAQASGSLGSVVAVRLLTLEGGDERIVQAVVRGGGMLEVAQ